MSKRLIIFDNETKEINIDLKKADGYMDCERIIIHNLKKHVGNKVSTFDLEAYPKKMLRYIEDKEIINRGNGICINYKYAVGFIKTIIDTPSWHSWLKAG